MKIIGITGGIGSGKTTATKIIEEFFMQEHIRVAVFNSDLVAKDIFKNNKQVIESIKQAFPGSLDSSGNIDRARLGDAVFKEKAKLLKLEDIFHPIIALKRKEFLEEKKKQNYQVALLDIPLLFEKGIDKLCHIVIAIRADKNIRKERIIKRVDYTEMKFHQINSHQIDDNERSKKAHYVIPNNGSLKDLERNVELVIKKVIGESFS